MAFTLTKASVFVFFLMALVICQQSLALGSSAKEYAQTSLDSLHVEHRRVKEEGTGQGSSSYIHDDSPVFTSDAPPSSDSMYLMLIGVFFAVAGLLRFAGLYFICFMLTIGAVFVGIVFVSS